MKILFEKTGTIKTLKELTSGLASHPDVHCLMVLGCDANGWKPEELNPLIMLLGIPVFGGIFPRIIHSKHTYEQGILVVGLTGVPEVILVRDISNPEVNFNSVLETYSDEWMEKKPVQDDTILVFVDGLSKRIASFVEALFLAFGLERNFIGGGTGSLSFKQKPSVITPLGLMTDVGLVVRIPLRSSVGVAHGWQPISESMKVTEAQCNTIHTLDWHPAFKHYSELVESHSGRIFAKENFFDIAKCYPFGINKLGGEVVVRDPLTTDGKNGLVCVGEVPTGSFVHLLNGTSETLIKAASHARHLALENAPIGFAENAPTLFIDCISRALFLENRVSEELEAVTGSGELFGAMTLGEIANNGRDYLEFYNKTAVVALLSEI